LIADVEEMAVLCNNANLVLRSTCVNPNEVGKMADNVKMVIGEIDFIGGFFFEILDDYQSAW
jgi:hypothetical protein